MNYIKKISAHWEKTIALAQQKGANGKQLQRLRELARTGFGPGSGIRLREDCFWRTIVDEDGDVVLFFTRLSPIDLSETQGFYIREVEARTELCVDHEGCITIKDQLTKETVVHFDTASVNEHARRLMQPFTESNFRLINMHGVPAMYVKDANMLYGPMLFGQNYCIDPKLAYFDVNRRVKFLFSVSEHHGPISGFLRYLGRLCWFQEAYEDEISSERIYSICDLTSWQRAKAHLNLLAKVIELHLNPAGKTWLKLPRFSVSRFGEKPFAFCVF